MRMYNPALYTLRRPIHKRRHRSDWSLTEILCYFDGKASYGLLGLAVLSQVVFACAGLQFSIYLTACEGFRAF